MTDDERARALIETLTRRPNGFHDALQVSEERAIQLIVAYGREERRRVWGQAAEILETYPNRLLYSVESCAVLDHLAAEFHKQQARTEETR